MFWPNPDFSSRQSSVCTRAQLTELIAAGGVLVYGVGGEQQDLLLPNNPVALQSHVVTLSMEE